MKKIFAIGLAGILSAAGLFAEQVLNGAGASFPAPVYQAWSYGYTQASGGVRVNYQSMGSGAGGSIRSNLERLILLEPTVL